MAEMKLAESVWARVEASAAKVDTIDKWNGFLRQFLMQLHTQVFSNAQAYASERQAIEAFVRNLDALRTNAKAKALPLFQFVVSLRHHDDVLLQNKDFDAFINERVPSIKTVASLGIAKHWPNFALSTRQAVAIFVLALYIAGSRLHHDLQSTTPTTLTTTTTSNTEAEKTSDTTGEGETYEKSESLKQLEAIFGDIKMDNVLPELMCAFGPDEMEIVMGAFEGGKGLEGLDPEQLKDVAVRLFAIPELQKVSKKMSQLSFAEQAGAAADAATAGKKQLNFKDMLMNIPDREIDELAKQMTSSPMLSMAMSQMPASMKDQLQNFNGASVKKLLEGVPDQMFSSILSSAGNGNIEELVGQITKKGHAVPLDPLLSS